MFICTLLNGNRTLRREVLTVGRGKGKLVGSRQKIQEPMTMERAIELAIEPLESMFPGSMLATIKAELTTKMQDLFREKDYFYRPWIVPGRRILDVIRARTDENGHNLEFWRRNAYLVRAIKRARRESGAKNSTVVFLIRQADPDHPVKPGLNSFIGRGRLDYNLMHPAERKSIFHFCQRSSFTLESI